MYYSKKWWQTHIKKNIPNTLYYKSLLCSESKIWIQIKITIVSIDEFTRLFRSNKYNDDTIFWLVKLYFNWLIKSSKNGIIEYVRKYFQHNHKYLCLHDFVYKQLLLEFYYFWSSDFKSSFAFLNNDLKVLLIFSLKLKSLFIMFSCVLQRQLNYS